MAKAFEDLFHTRIVKMIPADGEEADTSPTFLNGQPFVTARYQAHNLMEVAIKCPELGAQKEDFEFKTSLELHPSLKKMHKLGTYCKKTRRLYAICIVFALQDMLNLFLLQEPGLHGVGGLPGLPSPVPVQR